jgi:hypothetical protein
VTDGGGTTGDEDGQSSGSPDGALPLDATITVPDGGGTCTLLFDNFETDTGYWKSTVSAGAAQTRVTVNPSADAGMTAARFQTTANTQVVHLRRTLDDRPPPPCVTILLEAWFYPASTTNRPTILQIDRKHAINPAPIPPIKFVVQATSLDIIAGSTTLSSPTLIAPANLVWHRIRLEYTRTTGKVRVSVDANPFETFDLDDGPPTTLTFGVLEGMAGNDDLYFDDIALRY